MRALSKLEAKHKRTNESREIEKLRDSEQQEDDKILDFKVCQCEELTLEAYNDENQIQYTSYTSPT